MKEPVSTLPCAAEDCARLVGHGARGMCTTHDAQWKKARGITRVARPTLADRFWRKVKKTDGCWKWTASLKANGYGSFWNGERTTFAHRASWEIANGPIPEGALVDHMCFNHSCVNPDHMRLVTQKQNQENRSGQRSDNTSGYRGVSFSAGRWVATVYHNGKNIHCGRYDTPEDAHRAVTEARNRMFTHNTLDRINQQERAS